MQDAQHCIEGRGRIVDDSYQDIGVSRKQGWLSRPHAARLLRDAQSPGRDFDAIVVGASDRAWYGDQWAGVFEVFRRAGVRVFLPEVRGEYNPSNLSHRLTQSLKGMMSEQERATIAERVISRITSQVVSTGRYQGGRPPYGYRVVEVGPHPNPREAARGVMAKALDLDEFTAPVLQRIFREFLAGGSERSIAARLNAEGVPSPSTTRAESSTHPDSNARWSQGTLNGILRNPRVTGYEHWAKTKRDERLLDPLDPNAGYELRRIRTPERVVRSETMTHPQLISVADFNRAQTMLDAKAAATRP